METQIARTIGAEAAESSAPLMTIVETFPPTHSAIATWQADDRYLGGRRVVGSTMSAAKAGVPSLNLALIDFRRI